MSVRRVADEAVRLEVPVAAPFAQFRARYEEAVPKLPEKNWRRLWPTARAGRRSGQPPT
ncbi:hypothetical protein QRX50_30290 [Amycolatopsis carbonis]|uniref:Uncharacterized protein n=1 Tax=Amycolatopsis carbonis TaxID=715471 RepID=A0A9Y2MUC2_9PSEU|nr:hypothetical protein [Amycolatopsis sp. 2-15]WIX75759.1 hypothetical protein QRX50_30290 [Amycolatopsis sp. 2-15]